MRIIFLAMTALALSAPAFGDTLQEVTTRGIILTVQGTDIEVTYTPDGGLSALDGALTGTWRIDGDELCTRSNIVPEETCTAYPRDKRSGDTFELPSPDGVFVTVRIK